MRIAVISDVHSNIHALRAVLQDLEGKKVDAVYCAGDLVGYAPFPNEVIELIKSENIPTVLGNYDDTIGNRRLICGCDYKDGKAQALGEKSVAWTSEKVSEEGKAFLRGLPAEVRFRAGNYEVLIVHGSPRRLNEYLHLAASREYLLELLKEAKADVLICGHTHIPYHLELGGDKHVINAGSVGKPKHGDPSATYVVIELGETVQADIVRVAYDVAGAASALEESGLPREFADQLRKGNS